MKFWGGPNGVLGGAKLPKEADSFHAMQDIMLKFFIVWRGPNHGLTLARFPCLTTFASGGGGGGYDNLAIGP